MPSNKRKAVRPRGSGRKTVEAAPLHPNPQFTRPGWVSLNGPWQFAIDEAAEQESPVKVKWSETIEVPFAPETPASGVGREGLFAGCWYRRLFEAPPHEGGRRVLLRFGAVDYEAVVWVNGQVCAVHEGGYTPFHADITDLLRDQREQEVVVRVRDDPHDLAKPRGKQDWQPQPHSIWYPRTTGIWQSVWLETTGPGRLEHLSWTPNVERFEVDLWARTVGPTDGARLRVRLHAGQRLLADDEFLVVGSEVHRGIAVSDPGIDDYRNELLWSPERPTLIQADLELRDARGHVLDRIESYTALRSADVLGDRFLLNGRPRYLRMALDQGYWADSGLTPPSDAAARRDVVLALAMGFNGVRAHQRIPDPRFLYWADVLGLLVWEEMPSPYRFTAQAVMRLTNEWAAAIARDRSHPCVIVWVPMNESWGVPDLPSNPAHRHTVRAVYHLTKSLDPTRPVIGNDGWEMEVTDIIAIHDYEREAGRLRRRYQDRLEPGKMLSTERPGHRVLLLNEQCYRGQPIMLTEFGGIAMRQKGAWGYAEVEGPEALLTQYQALMEVVHELPMLAGFCYTQFADTYQEANGLLRADRSPKAPLEQIRRATLGKER